MSVGVQELHGVGCLGELGKKFGVKKDLIQKKETHPKPIHEKN